jgi:hypothetical protein
MGVVEMQGPSLEEIRKSPRFQKALALALEWAAEIYARDKEAEEQAHLAGAQVAPSK